MTWITNINSNGSTANTCDKCEKTFGSQSGLKFHMIYCSKFTQIKDATETVQEESIGQPCLLILKQLCTMASNAWNLISHLFQRDGYGAFLWTEVSLETLISRMTYREYREPGKTLCNGTKKTARALGEMLVVDKTCQAVLKQHDRHKLSKL